MCPFHGNDSEISGIMTIFSDGHYETNCCLQKADVVSFVMDFKGCSRPEAFDECRKIVSKTVLRKVTHIAVKGLDHITLLSRILNIVAVSIRGIKRHFRVFGQAKRSLKYYASVVPASQKRLITLETARRRLRNVTLWMILIFVTFLVQAYFFNSFSNGIPLEQKILTLIISLFFIIIISSFISVYVVMGNKNAK